MATVAPSQASTLVKELAQAAPLPGLHHLKRVQRLSTANSFTKILEVILYALPEKPALGHEEEAWAQQELEAISIPTAVTDLITRYSLQPRLAQVLCWANPPNLHHEFTPMLPIKQRSNAQEPCLPWSYQVERCAATYVGVGLSCRAPSMLQGQEST